MRKAATARRRVTSASTVSTSNGANRYQFLGKETQAQTGYVDLLARYYNPALGRFRMVDPLTDEQEAFSSYDYSFNNPIRFSDADGLMGEDCCGEVVNFLTGVGNALAQDLHPANVAPPTGGLERMGSFQSGRSFGHGVGALVGAGEIVLGVAGAAASGAVELLSGGVATPVAVPVAVASAGLVAHGANTMKNALTSVKDDYGRLNAKSSDPYSRVKPRKGTLEQITKNQPKNAKGEMLDPNTGKPIDPNRRDLGHKPGKEWRVRKEMHRQKGSTRKEVIEAQNDPSLYQWEDRSSNRSRRYEKKQ